MRRWQDFGNNALAIVFLVGIILILVAGIAKAAALAMWAVFCALLSLRNKGAVGMKNLLERIAHDPWLYALRVTLLFAVGVIVVAWAV